MKPINKAILIIFFVLVIPNFGIRAQEQKVFPNRWFFVERRLQTKDDLENIKSIVKEGSEHGLNGMVLSCSLDSIGRWKKEHVDLLKELDEFCRGKKVEIIPNIFSVGYGGAALGYDRNFAAALPITIPLVVNGNKAEQLTSGENLFKNSNFEEFEGQRFSETWHDKPGKISFVDQKKFVSGNTSIRFQDFHHSRHGHGRIMQKVAIKPGYSYCLSMMAKTENLAPADTFQVLVLREKKILNLWKMKGNSLLFSTRQCLKPTDDWHEVRLDFVNFYDTEVLVYAGVWGAMSGKLWIDGISLKENGSLAGIVRRKGTPLSLKSWDGKTKYVEDKDFLKVKNEHKLKTIRLTEKSSLKDGDKLLLSCYMTSYVGKEWGRQISLCMSIPSLYEYWESQAKIIYDTLKIKKVLLSMDEIRNGGGCLSCKKRGISMAEILGDCITKQYAIFKKIDSDIEVFIWSDMLDPNHNAHDNYYNVVGDFTGSWKHIPKDIIIICWSFKLRNKSLFFFSKEGFHTLGAAYYDADDLENTKDWIKSLNRTPNTLGIMYTTWRKKYKLLAPFGDLVSKLLPEP